MPKVTITNIDHDPRHSGQDAGLRGFHTTTGPRYLRPGESAEVEMTEGEIASSKRTGWFHFGDEAPAAPSYAGKSMAQKRMEGLAR